MYPGVREGKSVGHIGTVGQRENVLLHSHGWGYSSYNSRWEPRTELRRLCEQRGVSMKQAEDGEFDGV